MPALTTNQFTIDSIDEETLTGVVTYKDSNDDTHTLTLNGMDITDLAAVEVQISTTLKAVENEVSRVTAGIDSDLTDAIDVAYDFDPETGGTVPAGS